MQRQVHHEEFGRRALSDVEREASECGCGPAGCGSPRGMQRRTFVQLAGLGAAALSATSRAPIASAGPFLPEDLIDHCVPADKKLRPEWVRSLTERGTPNWYQGTDLATIGMPIGGIGAGQLYIAGDGRLVHWDIFNGPAPVYLYPDKPAAPADVLLQGFAIEVRQGSKSELRPLDAAGFPEVAFRGEYPQATVKYAAPAFPVDIVLESFSPFIPLNAEDSTLPATIMQFTVTNQSDQPVQGVLAGWLQNGVCRTSGETLPGELVNVVRRGEQMTTLICSARATEQPGEVRPPIVLADFEQGDYGHWKVEGEAFGTGPAQGTLAGQNQVSGFQGERLVNTFLEGDNPHGKLTSPPFEINRRYLSYLIGGGNIGERTCINLLVDGNVVLSATGRADERLVWNNWNVRRWEGKQGVLQIVDAQSGPWGHINVDQIELTDQPHTEFTGPLTTQSDFGTMSLSVLAPAKQARASEAVPADDVALPGLLFVGDALAETGTDVVPFGSRLCGAVGQTFELAAGATQTMRFVVAWNFPNQAETGHYYAARFADSVAVAEYVAQHIERLSSETALWVRTYYDSTLPYWLLDRLHSTVSTLATSTCQVWRNGRFWAFEGVRCCEGTCGHVWNYEHALARLFPTLERSVREMQDFNPEAGFVADTGMIRFRGVWPEFWCGDAQTGYILKAYREHQTSGDDGFLTRTWPQIRKALEFLIAQDGNDDGAIEGEQHNTYDINFYGPNPMVGILYLGALRAGEEMAKEQQDEALSMRCRKIFEAGRKYCTEKLFNGEYYVQLVDLKQHPKYQHADGCLADQLFGQGWAHQVALDYVLPKPDVRRALEAIWKYNWAPDIAPQNVAHPPQRWFAYPGEAGLFTCTWPKSKHLGPESVLYRDEIWTGIEYQVAGHMVWEGMLTEALAICRAVHERYHPAKHNPWNEIECGDHYARGMASWGVLIALAGFEYHGPHRHIGFVPRLNPQAFRSVFTAAKAWGTIDQRRDGSQQTDRIDVQWGELPIQSFACEVPAGQQVRECTVTGGSGQVSVTLAQNGTRVLLTLAEPVRIGRGESFVVSLRT